MSATGSPVRLANGHVVECGLRRLVRARTPDALNEPPNSNPPFSNPLGLATVFRRNLGAVIEQLGRRLSRLRVPGAEAEFAAIAEATRELAEDVVADPPTEIELPENASRRTTQDALHPSRLKDLLAEADSDPGTAIYRAWALVFIMGQRVAEMEGVQITSQFNDLGQWLGTRFVGMALPPGSLALVVYESNHLFHDVAYGRVKPGHLAARDFVQAAWRVAVSLESNWRKNEPLDIRAPVPPDANVQPTGQR